MARQRDLRVGLSRRRARPARAAAVPRHRGRDRRQRSSTPCSLQPRRARRRRRLAGVPAAALARRGAPAGQVVRLRGRVRVFAFPASCSRPAQAYGVFLFPLIPIAAAIAILKYRLYDIDVVIKRTLVYGALTADARRRVPGERAGAAARCSARRSDLAIAARRWPSRRCSGPRARASRRSWTGASTAAVRRRSARVEAFGARLRDEVSLDALDAELRAVVRETMQPAHVSVWLRDAVTLSGRPGRRTELRCRHSLDPSGATSCDAAARRRTSGRRSAAPAHGAGRDRPRRPAAGLLPARHRRRRRRHARARLARAARAQGRAASSSPSRSSARAS